MAVSDTARSSPSHADTERASSMRFQSGAPHEWPRWPRPSTVMRASPTCAVPRARSGCS